MIKWILDGDPFVGQVLIYLGIVAVILGLIFVTGYCSHPL